MEWLVAPYVLAAMVAVLGLGVALLAYRVVHAIRVYFKFRGVRLVTCPETHAPAAVEVAARVMGLQAILDDPCLRLGNCSRWPRRGGGCAQDCLVEIEPRPSALRISGECRASCSELEN